MKDKIVLIGLEFFGKHGCSIEEQTLGQKFLVDLEMTLDLSNLHDEISETVDYVEVANLTKKIVEGTPRKLIETVAIEIAGEILKNFAKIESIRVILHKPHSPVEFVLKDVSVEIFRSRQ